MKKYILLGFTLTIAILVVGFNAFSAQANPSRITAPDSCTTSSSSATTSISYMTPGTATTSVSCNLQRISAIAGGTDSVDSAVLVMQFHASSTALSELDWYLEYSQDGIDWYKENTSPVTGTTTTATPKNYAWRQYSTSTPYSSNGKATSSVDMKVISVTTPVRYVKATFTNPIGTSNVGVWASFISKIEKL